jgi:hypothetical protein
MNQRNSKFGADSAEFDLHRRRPLDLGESTGLDSVKEELSGGHWHSGAELPASWKTL